MFFKGFHLDDSFLMQNVLHSIVIDISKICNVYYSKKRLIYLLIFDKPQTYQSYYISYL